MKQSLRFGTVQCQRKYWNYVYINRSWWNRSIIILTWLQNARMNECIRIENNRPILFSVMLQFTLIGLLSSNDEIMPSSYYYTELTSTVLLARHLAWKSKIPIPSRPLRDLPLCLLLQATGSQTTTTWTLHSLSLYCAPLVWGLTLTDCGRRCYWVPYQ